MVWAGFRRLLFVVCGVVREIMYNVFEGLVINQNGTEYGLKFVVLLWVYMAVYLREVGKEYQALAGSLVSTGGGGRGGVVANHRHHPARRGLTAVMSQK